jgi:hypothetical protein
MVKKAIASTGFQVSPLVSGLSGVGYADVQALMLPRLDIAAQLPDLPA